MLDVGLWIFAALPIQRPTRSIGAAQKLVGLRIIRDLARSAVVRDLLPAAGSHQPQQHHFNHLPTVVEITRGLEVTLTRVYPLLLKIAHRRDERFFGSRFVIGQVGLIALREYRAGVEIGDETAFAALEHRTMVDGF